MKKLKSYNFWVRLASAVILILRIILAKFGYELDSAMVIDIATLIAGLLVVLGIINEPTGITISYDESKLNNQGMNLENKGDNYMTEQIKTDLMERVGKLSNVIQSNSKSDLSSMVQIITGMLDVISEIKEEDVLEDIGEEKKEVNPEEGVQVCFEHEGKEQDEYFVKEDENVLLQEENFSGEEERELTIDDVNEDMVVIETNKSGEKGVVKTLSDLSIEGENSHKTEGESESEISKSPAEELEKLIAKAEQIKPEISVETAFSVLLNNPEGLEQLKNYILSSNN